MMEKIICTKLTQKERGLWGAGIPEGLVDWVERPFRMEGQRQKALSERAVYVGSMIIYEVLLSIKQQKKSLSYNKSVKRSWRTVSMRWKGIPYMCLDLGIPLKWKKLEAILHLEVYVCICIFMMAKGS